MNNRLIAKLHDDVLFPTCRRYLSGRLIDIGCSNKPYASVVAPVVDEHVGVDHIDTLHEGSKVDLWGTAYDIPAEPNSFDSALCTAVLEHLEEPEAALRECQRLLKPGGIAIYTVPFIWQVHEAPRDFYRFSKYGLRYLFEKVGFEVLELRALSGFWGTFGQLLSYNIERANRGALRRLRIVDGVQAAIQGADYRLDRVDRTEQWTWMYLVVVRKRPTSSQDPEPI